MNKITKKVSSGDILSFQAYLESSDWTTRTSGQRNTQKEQNAFKIKLMRRRRHNRFHECSQLNILFWKVERKFGVPQMPYDVWRVKRLERARRWARVFIMTETEAGAGQAEDQELLIATHSPLICKFILLFKCKQNALHAYLFYHLLSTLGVEIETFYVFLIISF